MKIDSFVKGALGLIALCLVVLTLNSVGLIPTAKADATPHEGYALVPVNEDGSINVHVKGIDEIPTMDVNIYDISTSDKLNVNLESAKSHCLQYAGPLEVEVDD